MRGTSKYTNERRLANKKRKNEKRELKLAEKKEWRLKKFKDVDPSTVSGTTLQLMRDFISDPKWRQIKGKEVRQNYRRKK